MKAATMSRLRQSLGRRVYRLQDLYALAVEMGLDEGRDDLVQDGQPRWKRDVRNLLQQMKHDGSARSLGDGVWVLRGADEMPRLTLIWMPRPDLSIDLIAGHANRLLNYLDEPATLLIADPPFGITFGQNGGTSSYNRPDEMIVPGYVEIPADEYDEFTTQWVRVAYQALGEHGSVYVVSGPTHSHRVRFALEDAGFRYINSPVWHRQAGVFTRRRWVTAHYDILFYCKGDPDHPARVFHFPPDTPRGIHGQHYGEDVWRFALERHGGTLRYATMLPIALTDRCVLSASDEGNLVADPFMGGGPVAVSCARHNRRYCGVDANANAVWYTANRVLTEMENGASWQMPLALSVAGSPGLEAGY